MSGIRAFFVGVLAVGGAAMLAVGLMPGDGPEPARAATNHIVNIVTGGGYSPSTITIAPGDTVTFVNTSSTPGNAYAQLGGTDPNFWQTNAFIYAGQSSCAHKIGVTECWTFPNPGTYTYQNNLQSAPKPTGTIIVSSSGGGATATPTEGGGGGGGGGESTNHTVNIVTGGGYSPSSITIAAGDTVTFVNTSSTPGNAYSQLGGTDPNFFRTDAYVYAGNSSCAKRNTGTACWTFPNAGTFTYHNTLMSAPRPTGTIIVTGGSGGGGSPTNTPLPTNTPTPTKTPLPTNTPGGGGGGSPTNTPTSTKTPLPTMAPGGGGGGGGSATNTPLPTNTPGGGGQGGPTATPIPTQEAGQNGFGQMGPGWNLRVYYGPDVPVTQAVQGINGSWTVIYHWHGTGYSRYVKPGTAPPWVNSLHIVQNGQVYWIYIQ